MRTNKLISVHIVYNEEEFLKYTPLTALEFCDYCVFLDGGPNGPSTDGTAEILNNYKEKYGNKMHILCGTWGTNSLDTNDRNWDKEMRNAYCEYIEDNLLEEDEECWVLLWDSDETYLKSDMKTIRDHILIANKNEQIMIRYPYINFFYDIDHVVQDNNFSTPAHHLHIFRKGFRYWDVSTLMRDENGKILCHYAPYLIRYVEDIKLYHYGHISNYEKERLKSWRYRKRGDLGPDVAAQIPDKPEDWNWTDPREEEMKDTNRVKLYTGSHPEHMLPYIRKYNEKRSKI